jgi:DNA invertase Pin-like site-specific DNA recombinase
VSTQDQDLSAQLDALRKAGAATIFREKISGAHGNRPQLARLMASLCKGDVIVITKIDRLARSTRELLNLIHAIDEKGASLKSLGDPLFDTSSSQGRLLVAVLGAVAEFERDLIRERTGDGRKRALAAGVRFGRPKKMSLYQQAEALKRLKAGEAPSLIGRSYAVSGKTIHEAWQWHGLSSPSSPPPSSPHGGAGGRIQAPSSCSICRARRSRCILRSARRLKMRTLINLFAGAVLFLASAALADEPAVLSCTDAAATGFKWQKNSKEPDAVRFEPDRFTVRIISDEERVITRTTRDTPGEPLKFLCQRPFRPLVSCTKTFGTEQWVFEGNGYSRSYPSSLEKNIAVAYGTCTKF